MQKDDVIKVKLPDEIDMNEVGTHVLEAIHSIYLVDSIGNYLFIKYDGLNKERIHRKLVNSAETLIWYSASNGICVVGGADCRTTESLRVFFDENPDRSNALNGINHCQQYWIGIEYVGIAIPETICQNPNHRQASTAVVQQNNRPNQPHMSFIGTQMITQMFDAKLDATKIKERYSWQAYKKLEDNEKDKLKYILIYFNNENDIMKAIYKSTMEEVCLRIQHHLMVNISERLDKMKNKEDDTQEHVTTSGEKDKFNENKKRVVTTQGRREDESDSD
ncbi:hypothetical protein C1646_757236 [Rhizophagus diaphanus]|nr:hypothetical protein C1646_757236 [Rhizophagus diaphanus] [Rhizophagus sp. MUCL 43196]